MLPEEARIPLKNLASNVPLTRLKAAAELGALLREALDELVDAVELEQVRAARAQRPPKGWRDIGAALGVTQTHAHRRFAGRVS